jgi:hypothetical protein
MIVEFIDSRILIPFGQHEKLNELTDKRSKCETPGATKTRKEEPEVRTVPVAVGAPTEILN